MPGQSIFDLLPQPPRLIDRPDAAPQTAPRPSGTGGGDTGGVRRTERRGGARDGAMARRPSDPDKPEPHTGCPNQQRRGTATPGGDGPTRGGAWAAWARVAAGSRMPGADGKVVWCVLDGAPAAVGAVRAARAGAGCRRGSRGERPTRNDARRPRRCVERLRFAQTREPGGASVPGL
jgi:hypothetical protein